MEPQKETVIGNRVYADVMKVRTEMISYWIRVNPESKESVLLRDRTGTRKEAM